MSVSYVRYQGQVVKLVGSTWQKKVFDKTQKDCPSAKVSIDIGKNINKSVRIVDLEWVGKEEL